MSSPGVEQLSALAELFHRVLDYCGPESVAVLGVAGGNGLEQIDCGVTKRVVGVDINQEYLDEVRRRFGPDRLPGLELHCCDMGHKGSEVAPVALVHAALVFEHAGLLPCLHTAISMVAPAGHLSVVLQLPSSEAAAVSPTKYASIQTVKSHFALIDPSELQRLVLSEAFQLVREENRPLPGGKALWLGLFARVPEGQ
jgi:hypothetical protein